MSTRRRQETTTRRQATVSSDPVVRQLHDVLAINRVVGAYVVGLLFLISLTAGWPQAYLGWLLELLGPTWPW